ncbi:hypothetical protein EQG41_18370 [Billgrantia azerbaijanica]|nr:hypothetical protein EQG41_18370 [Halomonas azerbaijanica]
MALGLLGAALAGGGRAVEENADNKLKQMRDQAIIKMRQEFQRRERIAGQEFTAGENQQTRTFQAEQSGLDRTQQRELAEMREAGANNRSAMSRNDWEVMQANDGSLVRINSRTGDIQPMDAGDMQFGGESWSERDQAYVESLQSELESLQEIAKTGVLSDAQQQRMQEIPQEMRTYAQGIDVDDAVLGTYGNMRGGNQGGKLPPVGIRKPGLLSGGMPGEGGRGGGESPAARDVLDQRQQAQRQEAKNEQRDDAVEEMVKDAKRIAGRLTIPSNPEPFVRGGPSMRPQRNAQTDPALRQQAQQRLAELAEAFDAETDEQRKGDLLEAMSALQDAGITLPR